MGLIRIHPSDNVAVDTATGHKQALADIPAGASVIKYGFPIGHATADITAGEHVHTHNLATNLGDKVEYVYEPAEADGATHENSTANTPNTILAYQRPNGDIGIRRLRVKPFPDGAVVHDKELVEV